MPPLSYLLGQGNLSTTAVAAVAASVIVTVITAPAPAPGSDAAQAVFISSVLIAPSGVQVFGLAQLL